MPGAEPDKGGSGFPEGRNTPGCVEMVEPTALKDLLWLQLLGTLMALVIEINWK